MTPKAQATKTKINNWDYIKLKLLNSKGTIDSEKATYGTGENICKSYTWFATIYNLRRG